MNCGEACIYLGHADDHSAEVARFMKLSTKHVIHSRDVKWLEKTFQQYQESEGLYEDEDSDFESDESSASEDEGGTDGNESSAPVPDIDPSRTAGSGKRLDSIKERSSPRTTRSGARFDPVDDRVGLSGTTRSGVRFAPIDESIPERYGGDGKLRRSMQMLSASFNQEANDTVDKAKSDAVE